jgi:hypothetical protein
MMNKVTNKDGEEGYDSFWAWIMLHSSGSFNENKNTKNTIISCSEKNLSLFSARVATPSDNKNNTGGFTDSLCLSASSFQWALGPVSIQTISQKGNTYSRIFYTPNLLTLP